MNETNLTYQCPKCGQRFSVEEDADRYIVACPGCGEELDLTELEPEETAPANSPSQASPCGIADSDSTTGQESVSSTDDSSACDASQDHDVVSEVAERMKNVTGKAIDAAARIARKENRDKAKTAVSGVLKSGKAFAQRLSEKAPSKSVVKNTVTSLGYRLCCGFKSLSRKAIIVVSAIIIGITTTVIVFRHITVTQSNGGIHAPTIPTEKDTQAKDAIATLFAKVVLINCNIDSKVEEMKSEGKVKMRSGNKAFENEESMNRFSEALGLAVQGRAYAEVTLPSALPPDVRMAWKQYTGSFVMLQSVHLFQTLLTVGKDSSCYQTLSRSDREEFERILKEARANIEQAEKKLGTTMMRYFSSKQEFHDLVMSKSDEVSDEMRRGVFFQEDK